MKEKLIRWLIAIWLPGYYLSKKPAKGQRRTRKRTILNMEEFSKQFTGGE